MGLSGSCGVNNMYSECKWDYLVVVALITCTVSIDQYLFSSYTSHITT